MMSHIAFIALDLANDRVREAAQERLAHEAAAGRAPSDGVVVRLRRQIARGAVSIARFADAEAAGQSVAAH